MSTRAAQEPNNRDDYQFRIRRLDNGFLVKGPNINRYCKDIPEAIDYASRALYKHFNLRPPKKEKEFE